MQLGKSASGLEGNLKLREVETYIVQQERKYKSEERILMACNIKQANRKFINNLLIYGRICVSKMNIHKKMKYLLNFHTIRVSSVLLEAM